MIELLVKVYLGVGMVNIIRCFGICINGFKEMRDYAREKFHSVLYKATGLDYDWSDLRVNFMVDAVTIVTMCITIGYYGIMWPKHLFKAIKNELKGAE